jgi:hypothetical protein
VQGVIVLLRGRRYRQHLPRPRVEDVEAAVREELAKLDLPSVLRAGATVAVTAGSRGIAGIARLLAAVVGMLRSWGLEPFVVSAMGSHGGGTPDGQRRILAHLGITEESVGCPLRITSDVVEVGRTRSGWPVYCDAQAACADGILVVNRVKPHTSFRGTIESGLWKMMAVGLGKVPGATLVHRLGPPMMERVIREVGEVFLSRMPVVGGLGVVENGYEETALIRGLRPGEFEREAELLELAKSLLPRLPVDDVDVLIVDEMGKNYSGTGMDVNVIGRFRVQGVPEPERPRVKRLVVLDLSRASEGNANGIGLADITTRRLVSKIDFRSTYLNALTTTFFMRVAVPMTFETDREAVEAALRSLGLEDVGQARVLRIANTLELEEFWASAALSGELESLGLVPVGEEEELRFDAEGNLGPWR